MIAVVKMRGTHARQALRSIGTEHGLEIGEALPTTPELYGVGRLMEEPAARNVVLHRTTCR